MKCPSKLLLFALLVLSVIVFFGASAGVTHAAMQKPKPAAAQQTEEPESPPGYEDEYNCYESATKEADPAQKRGAMLIECIGKYPKSTLMPNFEAAFRNLLFECANNKKYQDLETLAEQWLKVHPGDFDTTARIAEAAANLGHDEKYVQRLLELYKMKPTSGLANDLAKTYKKMNNQPKYLEWTETAAKLPENESNFMLRLDLVQSYMEAKDLPKALDWARSALKAADLVKDPSAEVKTQLIDVRRTCHDIIGKIEYEQNKLAEAIKSFQQALKAKKYDEGFYYVALCLRKQERIDDAMLWYAKCQQMKGEFATKAKDNLEQIYKAIHNNLTIGIEKVYKKAQDQPEAFWIPAN